MQLAEGMLHPSIEARLLAYAYAVWCPLGRWGPRRTRVTECWSMVRAEDVYTALLRDDVTKMRPGARGSVTFTLEKRVVTSDWEIRQNAV